MKIHIRYFQLLWIMLNLQDVEPRCEQLGARASPARVLGEGRGWELQTVWKRRSVACNVLY